MAELREGLISNLSDLEMLEAYFGENNFLAEIERCFDRRSLDILANAIALRKEELNNMQARLAEVFKDEPPT